MKTFSRYVWQDYPERSEDIRLSLSGKAIYKRRKETVARVFDDAKEKHGMRYAHRRNLAGVTNRVRFKSKSRRYKSEGVLILLAILFFLHIYTTLFAKEIFHSRKNSLSLTE